MKGWIYVATNPCIPSSVKIGYSDRHPEIRIGELSGTSTPTPFEYAYGFLCDEPHKAEKIIHEALKEHRVSAERESFLQFGHLTLLSGCERLLFSTAFV
jgi:hypothetical protein